MALAALTVDDISLSDPRRSWGGCSLSVVLVSTQTLLVLFQLQGMSDIPVISAPDNRQPRSREDTKTSPQTQKSQTTTFEPHIDSP